EIAADENRQVAYQTSDAEDKQPTILDHRNFENGEGGVLTQLGEDIQRLNIHVIVFASDERCTPNGLVYLYRRALRYGINLHFSKLTTLELKCELRSCGNDNTFLDFGHPGVERMDICSVLKKAMVSPNLDGFTLLDALRHPKLVKQKQPLRKLLH